jgi:hypothetical protein
MSYALQKNMAGLNQRIRQLEAENVDLQTALYAERERCAKIAERVCREHADPKAGYAAATAIRDRANTSQLRQQGE